MIRRVVKDALASLDAEFARLYTDVGRPSIPPERLIHCPAAATTEMPESISRAR